jgi:hypothetical protein
MVEFVHLVETGIAVHLGEAERANPSPGPFRVQRVGRWWPTRWSESGSPRRFEEITRWERNSLRPHYGLPLGVRLGVASPEPAVVVYDTTGAETSRTPVDIPAEFLKVPGSPRDATAAPVCEKHPSVPTPYAKRVRGFRRLF